MDPQQPPDQFDLRSQPLGQAAPVPVATDPRSQIIERLKGSVNVLVTVSADPSVDQLAAAIGFTLVLNKLKKHGTAVFSGATPSTIEFLEPDKTIEKNTDSLRDFIVALDKSKADKLRYKVEDKFVKIFITPYHTTLNENDLEFGQGDFNVDVIIALGVGKKEELDQAITAHGRILHDATVVSITKDTSEDMGSINWHVPEASSFSEILVGLSDSLKSPQTELFDEQIATAFLTGIVAETDRFSNDKTTPQTMSMAAILMKAGANQQLIATKLEEPVPLPQVATLTPVADSAPPAAPAPLPPPPPPPPPPSPVSPDGSLQIAHQDTDTRPAVPAPPPPPVDDIHIDEEGTLHKFGEAPKPEPNPDVELPSGSPAFGSAQTGGMPLLDHDNKSATTVDHDDQTLEEIEKAVDSPHLKNQQSADSDLPPAVSADEARKNVLAAEEAAVTPPSDVLPPLADLGSSPVDLDLGHGDQPTAPEVPGGPDAPPPQSPPPMV